MYRTVGSSDDTKEIDRLFKEGKKEVAQLTGQQSLLFDQEKDQDFFDSILNSIEDYRLVGPDLVLGKLFDQIGFNKITDELFRYLVLTRLEISIRSPHSGSSKSKLLIKNEEQETILKFFGCV